MSNFHMQQEISCGGLVKVIIQMCAWYNRIIIAILFKDCTKAQPFYMILTE